MYDLVSLIYRGLQSEYEAVQIYKEVAYTARQIGQNIVADCFDEIAGDEMQHIGNLTELLKKFLPNDYNNLETRMSEGFTEVLEDISKYESKSNTNVNSSVSKYTDFLESLNCKYTITPTERYTVINISRSENTSLIGLVPELTKIRGDAKDEILHSKGSVDICVFG